MDTIIYVNYRQIQTDRSGEERKGNTHHPQGCDATLQTKQVQDYQVIYLQIHEAQEEQGLQAFSLEKCFPALRVRRQKKNHIRLAEQIREQLSPLLDEEGDNACIYAENIPQQTAQQSGGQCSVQSHVPAGAWVRELVPLPEFDAYLERKWISRLLAYAKCDHFLVLGTTDCLPQVLRGLAPRMKSLMWIAPDHTYRIQAESFAEDFYQEYGLAIDLRFLPEGGTFARLHISGQYLGEPLNVLDFTGEKYVPPIQPVPGSVWLDMGAVAEKEKRIRGRRMPVKYYSLKTIQGS